MVEAQPSPLLENASGISVGGTDHSPGSRLEQVLRSGRFAVTAELNPPDSADPQEVFDAALVLSSICDRINAVDASGALVGPGDAYAQTAFILQKIGRALEEAGASFSHVIRTRMFVTDISRFEEYGRAHGEVFGSIRPASTMVEVKALVDPRMLIEIEAEAYVET